MIDSNDDIVMMKRIFTSGDPQDIEQLTRYILEDDHGFELCVHTRNFIGGTAVATNITLAVLRSRRTIVLLSRYVMLHLCHTIMSYYSLLVCT